MRMTRNQEKAMFAKQDKSGKKQRVSDGLSDVNQVGNSIPKISLKRMKKIDNLNSKFIKLLKENKINEAEEVRNELNNIKYDTSEFVGTLKAKVKYDTIFGVRVHDYEIKPKPNNFGFDYWKDNVKITRGKRYLNATDFKNALCILSEKGEYNDVGKIIDISFTKDV